MSFLMNVISDKNQANNSGKCSMVIPPDKLSDLNLPVSIYIDKKVCLQITDFNGPAGIITVPKWVIDTHKFKQREQFYRCEYVYPKIATRLIVRKIDSITVGLDVIKKHIETCGVVNLNAIFLGYSVYKIFVDSESVEYAYTRSADFVDTELTLEIFNEENPTIEYITDTNIQLLKNLFKLK